MRVPVLLITGPVRVGKSSVLGEVEDLLQAAGMHFGAVELDALSYCHPPTPDDDRFRTKLTFRNVAAVWRNFHAAGAERLVLARVLASRDELSRYRRAIPGADLTVVRLRASVPTLRTRIAYVGVGRAWHWRRAAVLAKIMDRERVEDVLMETDGRTIDAIAREILDRTGWLPAAARRRASSRTAP